MGGAEYPSYCAVIINLPPVSSLSPFRFASPTPKGSAVAENKPATGDVVSLLIRSLSA